MVRKYKFILWCFVCIYITIGFIHLDINHTTLNIMGVIGLLQLWISIVSWYKCANRLFSPYIFFLIVLYVFSFGQSLLYPFGLISEKRDLYEVYSSIYGFTVSDIFQAQRQTLLMLAMFHIGGLSTIFRQNYSCPNYVNYYSNDNSRLKHIGWGLFIISVIPYTIDLVSDMVTSLSMGYGAIYGGEPKIGINNIWSFIGAYFIPSIICLFIAYKDHKKIRNTFLIIMLLISLAILITGGRSRAVILLCLVVILYDYLIKKFSKKQIFIVLICGIILLQVLAIIASTRTASIDERSYNVQFANNAAVEAIAEMGWTQFCLIESMKFVPADEDYRYGRSYLYAFTTIIPNLGFWEYHPAKLESNLGEWLTNKLGTNFGTGFSMCAEAWVNFGNLGFLLFYLWGFALASIFGKIDISIKNNNLAMLAFLLIIFWFSLTIPRNSFINLVRAFFYYGAPIYLYVSNFNFRRK